VVTTTATMAHPAAVVTTTATMGHPAAVVTTTATMGHPAAVVVTGLRAALPAAGTKIELVPLGTHLYTYVDLNDEAISL
jgi:hypothetical protein